MEIERSKDPFKDLINSIEGIDSLPRKLLPQPAEERKIDPPPVKRIPIPKPKDDIELLVQNIVLASGLHYEQDFVEIVADMLREAEVIKQTKMDTLLFSYIVLILWSVYTECSSKMDAMKRAWILGMAFNESMSWEEYNDEDDD
jgi:hypothetical protein